jgi:hypothetical protein
MHIETDERQRVHFLTGVEDYGPAYRCKRCGLTTATKIEMWNHRRGIISECDRKRLVDRLTTKKN